MWFRVARTLRGVPLVKGLFMKFPVRVVVWYPEPDGRLNIGRVDAGTILSLDEKLFFLLKSDWSLVDAAGYKDFDMKRSTLHLVQVGRGNYKPVGNFRVKFTDEGAEVPLSEVFAQAHMDDLYSNAYILQQEMDNERAPQKFTMVMMILGLGILLFVGLGIGLMYYLGNLVSPFNLTCACPVAIPSPVPPLVP